MKKKFREKFLDKNGEKTIFEKKCWKNKLQNKNIHNQNL